MRKTGTDLSTFKTVTLLAVFLFALSPFAGAAEIDLDTEFEFASGLVDLGFPDFAENVVARILKKHPDQKDRAKLIDAQILIARRKFDEAEAIVKDMSSDSEKAQAIRLALAQGYYRVNELDKAKQIYDDFFKQYKNRVPTDPDLKRFFMDAAYKFGQMLEQSGDYAGAAKAYDRVLAAKPDKNTELRLMSDQCMLYVRLAEETEDWEAKERYLARVDELANKIQWQGITIWFGHSVVAQARSQMARNKSEEAEKKLRGNLDILKQIDESLKENNLPMAVSPMAPARFLLGEINEYKGEKFLRRKETDDAIKYFGKALGEYYNVFAKYSDSDWGPEAGSRAMKIKDTLEGMGKTVNIDLGTHQEKVSKGVFKLANNLTSEGRYDEAITEYIKNLNAFPESEAASRGVVNLAKCYANTDDDLSAKMVARYVGERFADNDQVPMGLLSLGKLYFDKEKVQMYTFMYDTYLDSFPEHERAPAILYTLAGLRKKDGDEPGSMKYYQRIIEKYPNDQYFLKSINQLAWSQYSAKQYEEAAKRFEQYVTSARPGYEKARAQFTLADCYLRQDRFNDAANAYEIMIKWLAPKDSDYNEDDEEAKKNKELLRKSIFQRGFCYARLKEPAEKIKSYRETAIKAYDQYVKFYADSDFAPAAMSAKGAIQLEVGDNDGAAKTFEDLSKSYPDSPEGKSALFALVSAALDIGLTDQAKDAFRKMLMKPGLYGADQFARVGQKMLNNEMYAQADQAYEQVLVMASEDERKFIERALYGKGKAFFELKQFDKAVESLGELMEKYPKSGLFYDAQFMLAISKKETADLRGAQDALGEIFKYAEDNVLRHKASLELGQIQAEAGDKSGSLASFMRVALLGNPKNAEERPYIEQCTIEAIDLCVALSRHQDALDLIDQFLNDFPQSDRIPELRKLRGEEKIKAAQAAPPEPATAGVQ